MSKQKLKPAFTFIELLITIALLGILASIITSSMSGQQRKGRDSQRKNDLQQIKRAMEAAKNDCQSGIYYPLGTSANFNSTADLIGPSGLKYMDKSVRDPKNTSTYVYTIYVPSGPADNVCPDTSGGKTTKGIRTYIIRTMLEVTKDPDAEKSRLSCKNLETQVAGLTSTANDGYLYACPD